MAVGHGDRDEAAPGALQQVDRPRAHGQRGQRLAAQARAGAGHEPGPAAARGRECDRAAGELDARVAGRGLRRRLAVMVRFAAHERQAAPGRRQRDAAEHERNGAGRCDEHERLP
jgi:hypothetical protein